MSSWIANAVVIAVTSVIAGTAANAECASKGSTRCADAHSAVDLSAVPDIAKQIVGEEPISQTRKSAPAAPTAPTPYTGPIFGATSGAKRTPTVGYSWSLE
jgi:hypothetical protein